MTPDNPTGAASGSPGQRAAAAGARALMAGAAVLGPAGRAAAGAGLGLVAMALFPRVRRVADINLAIAYPALERKARRRLLRAHFAELGRAALELGPLWLWPLPRAMALIRSVQGEELVDQALAAGRGVLLFTAHLGAWEASVLYIGQRWPMTVMYMATRNPGINAMMVAGRSRSGARLVDKELGIRPLLAALKRGQAVGVLTDQNVDPREGVFAPLFGQPACTTPLLGTLAQRTGAAVFGLFCYRLPKGEGFRIEIRPMPEGFPSGVPEQDAAAMNTVLEAAIREAPAQYWWVHRRFKDQPEGIRPPY